jgi:hypothetical protein
MDGTTMRRFAEQDHRNGEHTDPPKNADHCWYCRDILSGESDRVLERESEPATEPRAWSPTAREAAWMRKGA